MKRNPDHFPSDFVFQPTPPEFNSLRRQSGTLKTGRGQRANYLPYTLTEHGSPFTVRNSPFSTHPSPFSIHRFHPATEELK
ncbi:MAG: ORF6N domain-containing protein [Candidatus Hydrogenedentes bacterium]|nr:ORF6N domain-containing protein [Candidatus Hydrogenedentota bacterium]